MALGAVLILLSASADSASIFIDPDPEDAIVFVQGPLTPGEDRAFRSQDLAKRARSFVNAVTAKWSGTNAAALAGLDALYAAEVDYYGKRLSRDGVLADKRRFIERWPKRTYKIQSSYEQCTASACFVDGYMEWEARSPARRAMASGVTGFRYVLVPSGGAFVIKGEGGNVLRRTQIPSQPDSVVARGAKHHAVDGQDVALDQQLHAHAGAERLRENGIEHDVKQRLADPDEREPPSQPGPTVAREAQSDERAVTGQGVALDQQFHAHGAERLREIAIEHDVKRLLADPDERKPPPQLVPTTARETQPGGREAVRQWRVFDAHILTAAAILLAFLFLRSISSKWRKSKTKVEAEANRQAEHKRGAEKRSEARQSRGRPWRRCQPRTGSRVPPEAQQHGAEKEKEAEAGRQEQEREAEGRRRQAEKEREAERQRQRERELAMNGQSEQDEWWSVLEVSPEAGKDEIVRSYRRKIQRCHPDRVCGLAPEFILLAESRTKALNEAYAQAMRALK
jgi:DnaJ domain